MIRGITIGSFRISLFLRKVTKVYGVNSKLAGGGHCIMMDCEDCSLRQLETEIWRLQNKYALGAADIFQTSAADHFHVYIWTRLELNAMLQVLLDCRYEDYKHIVFSTRRKWVTLRLTDKYESKITYLETLTSQYANTCSERDLESFTLYQTANKPGVVNTG